MQANVYFLKKINNWLRNQILYIFVTTTENSWVVCLGPNNREIVDRRKGGIVKVFLPIGY